MARKPRIHFPGAFYHVILRGNDGRDIFNDHSDRLKFNSFLEEAKSKYIFNIHGYCLMSNHVHLVIQVEDIPLSRIMQNISLRYTKFFNSKIESSGHLFQGRYKAILIDADAYLVQLIRYIHFNPVRAGIVDSCNDYSYSSYLDYQGMRTTSWLTTNMILGMTSEFKQNTIHHYADFIIEGDESKRRDEFYGGTIDSRVLGDELFTENVLSKSGERDDQNLTLDDVIQQVSKKYNIKSESLINGDKEPTILKARAEAANIVNESSQLTLTELAELCNRDISTMSAAARKFKSESESSFCES